MRTINIAESARVVERCFAQFRDHPHIESGLFYWITGVDNQPVGHTIVPLYWGSLEDLIDSEPSENEATATTYEMTRLALRLSLQLLTTLKHINDQELQHNDLHAGNILIDLKWEDIDNARIVIADLEKMGALTLNMDEDWVHARSHCKHMLQLATELSEEQRKSLQAALKDSGNARLIQAYQAALELL